MKIEFEEIANAAGGAELFERLAEWLDKQISKAVLGQTMTTDDGSSQSQANVHNEVRMDILRADAKQLAATLNRLVRNLALPWGGNYALEGSPDEVQRLRDDLEIAARKFGFNR